jgi:hypothetical protein
MLKKLVITFLVLVSISSIIWGGYWLGNTAYKEGLHDGITAVVEQCAQPSDQPWVFFNGKTGNVMECVGGHVTAPELSTPSEPEKTAPKPDKGPSWALPPQTGPGEPGSNRV